MVTLPEFPVGGVTFQQFFGYFSDVQRSKFSKFSARAFGARNSRVEFGLNVRQKTTVSEWAILQWFGVRVCLVLPKSCPGIVQTFYVTHYLSGYCGFEILQTTPLIRSFIF